ncbi:retrovirus-related pol polyprotein from transposon TNT 1-94 [Tanacetum coccineum]
MIKETTPKPKSEDTNQEKTLSLQWNLCGLNACRECQGERSQLLIIVDDYSRFTWVKCLRSKDEAPTFIINFLKMIQVRLKETVRRIRTDNGTEFVNQTLREYNEKVGILIETSVARSGLVPNPPPSTPFVPPSRSDWDLLFQPMFDESLNPPPYVDLQVISMDKSKITRKQSKTSKHEHENQKSTKRSQRIKAEARKVKPQSKIVNHGQ